MRLINRVLARFGLKVVPIDTPEPPGVCATPTYHHYVIQQRELDGTKWRVIGNSTPSMTVSTRRPEDTRWSNADAYDA